MKKLLLALLLIPTLLQAQDFRHRYFQYDQFVTPDTLQILGNRADGSDAQRIFMSGGGAISSNRGAFVQLNGNEASGAGDAYLAAGGSNGSSLTLSCPSADGAVDILTNGSQRLSIPSLADADDVSLVLGAASTTAPIFTVRAATADGDDDGVLYLTPGGAADTSWNGSRGGNIALYGNENASAGRVQITGGDATGSNIQLKTKASNGAIELLTNGVGRLSIPGLASADNVDLVLGSVSTTAPVFTLRGQTADADDDGALCLAAGGACNDENRGAFVQAYGNERAGGGDLFLYSGNASTSDVYIKAMNANSVIRFSSGGSSERWVMNASGDLVADSTNGGNVTFSKVGTDVVHTVTTKVANGSTQADAVALTAVYFTMVSAADGAKGAKFPAYSSYQIGHEILVHNNSASALKLYSNAAGDLINDVAGTTAYSIAAHVTATCVKYDATHVYCG